MASSISSRLINLTHGLAAVAAFACGSGWAGAKPRPLLLSVGCWVFVGLILLFLGFERRIARAWPRALAPASFLELGGAAVLGIVSAMRGRPVVALILSVAALGSLVAGIVQAVALRRSAGPPPAVFLNITHYAAAMSLFLKGVDKTKDWAHYWPLLLLCWCCAGLILAFVRYHHEIEKKWMSVASLVSFMEAVVMAFVGAFAARHGQHLLPYAWYVAAFGLFVVGIVQVVARPRGGSLASAH